MEDFKDSKRKHKRSEHRDILENPSIKVEDFESNFILGRLNYLVDNILNPESHLLTVKENVENLYNSLIGAVEFRIADLSQAKENLKNLKPGDTKLLLILDEYLKILGDFQKEKFIDFEPQKFKEFLKRHFLALIGVNPEFRREEILQSIKVQEGSKEKFEEQSKMKFKTKVENFEKFFPEFLNGYIQSSKSVLSKRSSQSILDQANLWLDLLKQWIDAATRAKINANDIYFNRAENHIKILKELYEFIEKNKEHKILKSDLTKYYYQLISK